MISVASPPTKIYIEVITGTSEEYTYTHACTRTHTHTTQKQTNKQTTTQQQQQQQHLQLVLDYSSEIFKILWLRWLWRITLAVIKHNQIPWSKYQNMVKSWQSINIFDKNRVSNTSLKRFGCIHTSHNNSWLFARTSSVLIKAHFHIRLFFSPSSCVGDFGSFYFIGLAKTLPHTLMANSLADLLRFCLLLVTISSLLIVTKTTSLPLVCCYYNHIKQEMIK